MPSFIADHPMLCALALIFIDIGVWRLISADLANWKLAARLVIFAVFSAVLFNDGMNPMLVAPYADNTALHLAATALQIGWWLFAARTLTVLLGAVMMQRVGHTGRLLQDLLGAVIFLIAIIAAMAYVLDLPVKGVLATSGAVAIIVGLALQSTLSDVFPGSCSTPPSRTSSVTGFPSTALKAASPISTGVPHACRRPRAAWR